MRKKKHTRPAGPALAPAKIPIDLGKSFLQHVRDALDKHCDVNSRWTRMTAMAPNFATHSFQYSDAGMLEDGILRSVEDIDWSLGGLTEICNRVELPAIAIDSCGAIGPYVEDIATSWLTLRLGHPEATNLMMEGRLGTGIRMVMAVDSEAEYDLAHVVAFHGLECAYLAAEDAQERLRNLLQVEIRNLQDNRVTRNGALADLLRDEWARATAVQAIFQRSGLVADSQDSAWVSTLGLDARAAEQRLKLTSSIDDLLKLLGRLLEEGRAATADLPARLDGFRSKQWSLQEVHRWLGTPAIPLLWNNVVRAAHVHSATYPKDVGVGIAGEGKRDSSRALNSWAEQIVRDTNQGNPPVDLLSRGSELQAELPRLLCHMLRIDVVQDEDAVPNRYKAAATRRRALGDSDPRWQEPYTFEKVVEGLEREGKSHGSRFLVEASKEGNALIEKASANPGDPQNQRILMEAQGRLWFRLRL